MASIDCLLLKRRLLYLARLLSSSCDALLALLSQSRVDPASHKVIEMRWVILIRRDLRSCFECSAEARSCLPDPDEFPGVWHDLIKHDRCKWKSIVSNIFFYESVCDASRHKASDLLTPCFKCVVAGCDASFSTAKACNSHIRAKHKIRSDRRVFAHADCICQACKTKFSNRPRLIAHWSDPRRPKCWAWVSQNVTPMNANQAKELDDHDRELTRQARAAGHTRPMSSGPVKKMS